MRGRSQRTTVLASWLRLLQRLTAPCLMLRAEHWEAPGRLLLQSTPAIDLRSTGRARKERVRRGRALPVNSL